MVLIRIDLLDLQNKVLNPMRAPHGVVRVEAASPPTTPIRGRWRERSLVLVSLWLTNVSAVGVEVDAEWSATGP
jgi:hypothetical protein